jgi:hypothetical protein
VTGAAIRRVLSGQATYDSIPEEAQAVVRVAWDERIAARIEGLNLEQRLSSAGRVWVDADKDGSLVVHSPR